MRIANQEYVPFAHEPIDVSTTAIGLTAGTYAPADVRAARYAEITVEDADLRYRTDGPDPTAAEGHRRKVDTEIISLHSITEITNFKAIREGGTDAKIRVTYYR